MARNADDSSNAVSMLHTSLVDTRQELRNSLSDGFALLRTEAGTGHRDTREAVAAELKSLRTELLDATRQFASGKEELSRVVREALLSVREEAERLRTTVDEIHAREAVREAAAQEAALDAVNRGGRSGQGTAAAHPAPGPRDADRDAAGTPDHRDRGQERASAAGAEQETAEALLVERVTESVLAALRGSGTGTGTGTGKDTSTGAGTSAGTSTATATTPAAATEPPAEPPAAPPVTDDHGALLKRAARVSSASLVCHRDTWEFITGQAGRHPHFRMPLQITDRSENRIAAALSGRSLIAVLICLFNTQHTADEGDGDWALATTIYSRIHDGLDSLDSTGAPVTITLDDRTPGGEADQRAAAAPEGAPKA
jgi:hypothetical protein